MNSLVSVVIPAYNAAQYLPETIESVLAQTFHNFELLIIDNGSTDNTAEVAYQYSQQDQRIKLFSDGNPCGVSAARNKGIQLAVGKVIAFIDADDQWLPNKLTSHIEHLNQDTNLGVSFGRVEFLSPDGKPTRQFSNSRLSDIQPQHFLYENPTITVSNLVVRREIFEQVGGFEESMRYSEDMDFLLRVACSNRWKIEGLNEVLTRYRTSPKGLSSNLQGMEEGWNLLVKRAKHYAPELVTQHYSKARATYLRYLARRAFRCGLPSPIGVDFMNRALHSDWQLILKEPRRTFLTMLAVYGQNMMSFNKPLKS